MVPQKSGLTKHDVTGSSGANHVNVNQWKIVLKLIAKRLQDTIKISIIILFPTVSSHASGHGIGRRAF